MNDKAAAALAVGLGRQLSYKRNLAGDVYLEDLAGNQFFFQVDRHRGGKDSWAVLPMGLLPSNFALADHAGIKRYLEGAAK